MRIVVVVKRQSEYFREADEWRVEFSRETGQTVEIVDPETIEGEIFASARDIMQYSCVVVLGAGGEVVKKWSGSPLPQFDQVSYVLRSV